MQDASWGSQDLCQMVSKVKKEGKKQYAYLLGKYYRRTLKSPCTKTFQRTIEQNAQICYIYTGAHAEPRGQLLPLPKLCRGSTGASSCPFVQELRQNACAIDMSLH